MSVASSSSSAHDPRVFWLLQFAGWFGYFVFSYVVALAHGRPSHYWCVPLSTAVAGLVATSLLRYLLRRFAENGPLRFFGIAAMPMLMAVLFISLINSVALSSWCPADCRPGSSSAYVAYVGTFTWVVLAWTLMYWAVKTSRRLQEQTAAVLAAQAAANEAQLKMLRYQLNPHFLFNTLNAISTLVLDRDIDTANKMVTSLSAFLRHSLDADPMQRTSLRQELDALRLYLGIEQLRFTDRLRLRVEVSEEAYGAAVPSFLLQPLVENAIKYAVAPRVEGGTIEIRAWLEGDRLQVEVRDDGPGFPAARSDGLPPGRGVGLRNARERLRVLYGARHEFALEDAHPHGAVVRIGLPFEAIEVRRS
jgi:signal transduction histidine kinase